MKLLILTQKVNKKDPILGFFHRWIEIFSSYFEHITVICLEKGEYDLPKNVQVFSLGKEAGVSKFFYLRNFYRTVLSERKNYDVVFVHMNQEYVLLGAFVWGLLGKKIYMWRNHPVGNFLTSLSVLLCDITFCTSKYSYINRFKKNVLMPVGIDTEFFSDKKGERTRSVLFLGRIAPLKRPDLLISALKKIREKEIPFSATFYGSAHPDDQAYFDTIKKDAYELGDSVRFYEAIPQSEVSNVYSEHTISVNLSPSGMFDKTIFEAALCGTLPLNSNENLRGEIDSRLFFEESSVSDLVQKLEVLLLLSHGELVELRERSRSYAYSKHSLSSLGEKLFKALRDDEEKRPFLGTILKYLVAGGTSAGVDILVLYILNGYFRLSYIPSSVLAFLVAFGVSFTLQKFWTFRDSSLKIRTQATKYFFVTSCNLLLNTLLMYIFVDLVPLPYFLDLSHPHKVLVSQVIVAGLVALQSFFLYQKFVFTSNRSEVKI